MTDRQLLAAADLACKASILDRCVNTADRTRYRAQPGIALSDTVSAIAWSVFAKEQGLDPAWVYGLIRQESRFLYRRALARRRAGTDADHAEDRQLDRASARS